MTSRAAYIYTEILSRKTSTDMPPEGLVWPPWASRPIGRCRRIHAAGPEIHSGVIADHPGTLGTVARPIPVRDCWLTRMRSDCQKLGDGRPRLADKTTESSFATW